LKVLILIITLGRFTAPHQWLGYSQVDTPLIKQAMKINAASIPNKFKSIAVVWKRRFPAPTYF